MFGRFLSNFSYPLITKIIKINFVYFWLTTNNAPLVANDIATKSIMLLYIYHCRQTELNLYEILSLLSNAKLLFFIKIYSQIMKISLIPLRYLWPVSLLLRPLPGLRK